MIGQNLSRLNRKEIRKLNWFLTWILEIFDLTYSSHHILNQKSVGYFFLQKSTFGWVCNSVLQKWGHANSYIQISFRIKVKIFQFRLLKFALAWSFCGLRFWNKCMKAYSFMLKNSKITVCTAKDAKGCTNESSWVQYI